jgi:hypothetical protein
MSQTSINPAGQPYAIAGLDADSGEGKDVVSWFNEGTTEVAFGCGVVQGTAEKGGKAVSGSSDVCIGVNTFGYNHMPGTGGDLGSTGLVQYAGGQAMRRGRIWVPIAVGATIAVNDRAYLLFESDAGSNTMPGVWSNANTGSHYIDLTKVGVFRSTGQTAPTATGGGATIAILEVDFTNKP